jgi:hypothetical protein
MFVYKLLVSYYILPTSLVLVTLITNDYPFLQNHKRKPYE